MQICRAPLIFRYPRRCARYCRVEQKHWAKGARKQVFVNTVKDDRIVLACGLVNILLSDAHAPIASELCQLIDNDGRTHPPGTAILLHWHIHLNMEHIPISANVHRKKRLTDPTQTVLELSSSSGSSNFSVLALLHHNPRLTTALLHTPLKIVLFWPRIVANYCRNVLSTR